jgi:hypothetical protein
LHTGSGSDEVGEVAVKGNMDMHIENKITLLAIFNTIYIILNN